MSWRHVWNVPGLAGGKRARSRKGEAWARWKRAATIFGDGRDVVAARLERAGIGWRKAGQIPKRQGLARWKRAATTFGDGTRAFFGPRVTLRPSCPAGRAKTACPAPSAPAAARLRLDASPRRSYNGFSVPET